MVVITVWKQDDERPKTPLRSCLGDPDSCRLTPSIAWRLESPIDRRHGQGHMDHQRLAKHDCLHSHSHLSCQHKHNSYRLRALRVHISPPGINPAKSKQRHSIRHCRPYLFQQRQLNLFRQLRASMAERNCTVRGTRTTQDNYWRLAIRSLLETDPARPRTYL